MDWNRIGISAARDFLDFSGRRGDDSHWARIAERQLEGAVALYNRLADRRVAWMADEVGMGKTYIALGVAALLRHQHPDARILFLIPSARLQSKWIRERLGFTESVVRQVDHRARTLQDRPARPVVEPRGLFALAAELVVDPDRDVLAPLSSFSFGLSRDPSRWRDHWRRLAALSPHLPKHLPAECYDVHEKARFKRLFAAGLNLVLPTFDLVICDESHNLRRGASHGASRNQTVAAALGGHRLKVDVPWDAPPVQRVRRLLCLTATPVEHDYSEMTRQAEVFGLPLLRGLPSATAEDLKALASDAPAIERKDVARRYIVRRLHELYVPNATQGLTKNQYRLEWRHGGLRSHDDRLQLSTGREQLMVALVQKKVLEALHESGARRSDGAFLPSFQMGMLSSFESFGETIANRTARARHADDDDPEKAAPTYDGEDQTRDPREREGLDSNAVDRICGSYRTRFGASPPHPKLDQAATALTAWAQAGDKSVVFVRRVRTTEELAGKVGGLLDEWLIDRLRAELPQSLHTELNEYAAAYWKSRRVVGVARPVAGTDTDEDDAASTFFASFFRGDGTRQRQAGARLRYAAFQDAGHPWSVFFRDNHVAWLLDDDPAAIRDFAAAHADRLERYVRLWVATKTPGPRHWFDAWQAAGLRVLAEMDPRQNRRVVAEHLKRMLPSTQRSRAYPEELDATGSDWLAAGTFFSRLRTHQLGPELWPGAAAHPEGTTREVRAAIEERIVRRELLSSTLRLGHSYTELWTEAVSLAAGFKVSAVGARDSLPVLIDRMLQRLTRQRAEAQPRLNVWRELKNLAAQHSLLMHVNFSGMTREEKADPTRYFAAKLGQQSPVLGMHGQSKSDNALIQFRMPGYPLVIVSTDILQEGVDLHTFCGRVLHYGVACTSSATEQRTGRVDRIGSLVHRRFATTDGASGLQVHYPHLMDTVEPLQLQVLYKRMDRFMKLVHDGLGSPDDEASRVEVHHGMHQEVRYPPPHSDRLTSAFDVRTDGPDDDLTGGKLADAPNLTLPDPTDVLRRWCEHAVRPGAAPAWEGEVWVAENKLVAGAERDDHARVQPFFLQLRTRRDGRGLYVRVHSPVGRLNLSDGRTCRSFLNAHAQMPGVQLFAHLDSRTAPLQGVWVHARTDLPIDPKAPQRAIERALRTATVAADQLERWYAPGQDRHLDDLPPDQRR